MTYLKELQRASWQLELTEPHIRKIDDLDLLRRHLEIQADMHTLIANELGNHTLTLLLC